MNDSALLSQTRDQYGSDNFFAETGLPVGILDRDIDGNGHILSNAVIRDRGGQLFNIEAFHDVVDVYYDTAIRAALDLAIPVGGEIFFPPRATPYPVDLSDGPFEVDGGGVISGGRGPYALWANSYGSMIQTTAATGDIFYVTPTHQPVTFRDISIGTAVARTSGAYIHQTTTHPTEGSSLNVINVQLFSPWIGIWAQKCSGGIFENVNCSNVQGVGIILENQANPDAGENTFKTCAISAVAAAICMSYRSGAGLRILGCKFLGGAKGLEITSTGGSVNIAGGHISVSDCSFDGQVSRCIEVGQANVGDVLEMMTVTGNVFANYGNTSNDVRQILIADNGTNSIKEINITGNVFHYVLANGLFAVEFANAISDIFFGGNVMKGSSASGAVKVGAGVLNSAIAPNVITGFATTITNLSSTTVVAEFTGSPVLAKTTTYEITISDHGTMFNNNGAAGEVDFVLPAGAEGLCYTFYVFAGQILKIIADSGHYIRIGGSATTGDISSSTVGNTITLKYDGINTWICVGREGTWTVT